MTDIIDHCQITYVRVKNITWRDDTRGKFSLSSGVGIRLWLQVKYSTSPSGLSDSILSIIGPGRSFIHFGGLVHNKVKEWTCWLCLRLLCRLPKTPNGILSVNWINKLFSHVLFFLRKSQDKEYRGEYVWSLIIPVIPTQWKLIFKVNNSVCSIPALC